VLHLTLGGSTRHRNSSSVMLAWLRSKWRSITRDPRATRHLDGYFRVDSEYIPIDQEDVHNDGHYMQMHCHAPLVSETED
jgi:hypothetical protein